MTKKKTWQQFDLTLLHYWLLPLSSSFFFFLTAIIISCRSESLSCWSQSWCFWWPLVTLGRWATWSPLQQRWWRACLSQDCRAIAPPETPFPSWAPLSCRKRTDPTNACTSQVHDPLSWPLLNNNNNNTNYLFAGTICFCIQHWCSQERRHLPPKEST